MTTHIRRKLLLGLAALTLVVLATGGLAPGLAQDETELAKKTQNPLADLISVPFQTNFNFGGGSNNVMQRFLNFQPVIPCV